MHIRQEVFQNIDAVELKAFHGLSETVVQTAFKLGGMIWQRKIGNMVFRQTDNQIKRRGMLFDGAAKGSKGRRGVPSKAGHNERPSEKRGFIVTRFARIEYPNGF